MTSWKPVSAIVLAAVVGVAVSAGAASSRPSFTQDDSSWSSSSVKELRELHIAHKAESPLVVETGNGAIKIVKGGSENVDVRATVTARDQQRLGQIKVIAVRSDDGVLTIKAKFPDGRPKGPDGVSLEIIIPDARGLTLKTSNGPIEADGFEGKLVADTSNGAITIDHHAGDAVLSTSNGPINASNIAASVNADTSNGRLLLKNVGTPLVAQTSNGPVDITLRPEATGPVKIDTSNGAIKLGVGASFGGSIVAETSNGAVKINTGAKAWKVNMKDKTHASIDTGASGEKSVLDTSNGPITITAE